MTAQFAIVGDPVAHSLSPFIHGGWLKTHGIDAEYGRVHLVSENAAPGIRELAKTHSGLNVTLPHKQAALAAARDASPEAKRIGAANTLARGADGAFTAHNTDLDGFIDALKRAAPDGVAGKRVVLIGAGGAARAAVDALRDLKAELVIANRTPANAHTLAEQLYPGAGVASLEQIPTLAMHSDVVINSASFGHAGASLPALPGGRGRPFLDLSYGKAAAATLSAAGEAGWTPHDGLPMLVSQAAAAFRIWFGITPDQDEALARCRAQVEQRT